MHEDAKGATYLALSAKSVPEVYQKCTEFSDTIISQTVNKNHASLQRKRHLLNPPTASSLYWNLCSCNTKAQSG